MYKKTDNTILIEKNFFNLKKGRRYITKDIPGLNIQNDQYFIRYSRLYHCVNVEYSPNEKCKVIKVKINNTNSYKIWVYDHETLKLIVEEEPLIC